MGGIVNAHLWICVLYLQAETEQGSEHLHLLNILSGYLVNPLNSKVFTGQVCLYDTVLFLILINI